MSVAGAHVVAVGLLLAVPSARSVAAPACRDSAHIVAVWENREALGRPLSAPVEREVTSLFRRAGVAIEWRERTSGDEVGEDLSVTILAAPRAGTLPRRAMGAVNRGSSRVFVFLSGMEHLLGHSVQDSGDDAANAARLVGRVVAHEIVHVVAPGLAHTRDGLMQAQWDRTFAFRPRLPIGDEVASALQAAFACGRPETPPGTVAKLKGDGSVEGDYSDDPSSS